MDFSGPPDSFYYKHGKEHFGRALFTREGILNAATMIFWMAERLESADMLTSGRQQSLVTSFFHACVLRAIDMGNRDLARELIETAASNGLVADAAPKFGIYEIGRKLTSGSNRLTYYWNRFARRFVLSPWYSDRPSSYASVPATAIT
jgi:hypothetical protein